LKNVLIINASPNPNGATKTILDHLSKELCYNSFFVKSISLNDFKINYCFGCKVCYSTSTCVQHDDIAQIMNEMERADIIVTASPSYWGDVTGQLKVFIDRCTPYCNTHIPHAKLSEGKRGFSIALRTGTNPNECVHIVESINHFYGHMGILFDEKMSMYLCGIKNADDISKHYNDISIFTDLISAI